MESSIESVSTPDPDPDPTPPAPAPPTLAELLGALATRETDEVTDRLSRMVTEITGGRVAVGGGGTAPDRTPDGKHRGTLLTILADSQRTRDAAAAVFAPLGLVLVGTREFLPGDTGGFEVDDEFPGGEWWGWLDRARPQPSRMKAAA